MRNIKLNLIFYLEVSQRQSGVYIVSCKDTNVLSLSMEKEYKYICYFFLAFVVYVILGLKKNLDFRPYVIAISLFFNNSY